MAILAIWCHLWKILRTEQHGKWQKPTKKGGWLELGVLTHGDVFLSPGHMIIIPKTPD